MKQSACVEADSVQTYQHWMESVRSIDESASGEVTVMAWRDEWKEEEASRDNLN